MTTRVVVATHNPHKLEEVRRIMDVASVDGLELVSAAQLGLDEPEETGATFAENALIKARAAAAATGLAALADDSGLVVDALGGEPGVRSARYAGRHGDDDANLRLVLERMSARVDRRARFVCVAALVAPAGEEVTVEGVVEGELTTQPRGSNGFGYDPIFKPLGAALTTAEMPADQKDALSHRGKAFRAIADAVRAHVRGHSIPPRSTS